MNVYAATRTPSQIGSIKKKDGMVFHHAVLCMFVRFPVGLDGGGLIILYLFCVDLRSYFSRSSRRSAPKLAAVMRRQSPSGNGSAVCGIEEGCVMESAQKFRKHSAR